MLPQGGTERADVILFTNTNCASNTNRTSDTNCTSNTNCASNTDCASNTNCTANIKKPRELTVCDLHPMYNDVCNRDLHLHNNDVCNRDLNLHNNYHLVCDQTPGAHTLQCRQSRHLLLHLFYISLYLFLFHTSVLGFIQFHITLQTV